MYYMLSRYLHAYWIWINLFGYMYKENNNKY